MIMFDSLRAVRNRGRPSATGEMVSGARPTELFSPPPSSDPDAFFPSALSEIAPVTEGLMIGRIPQRSAGSEGDDVVHDLGFGPEIALLHAQAVLGRVGAIEAHAAEGMRRAPAPGIGRPVVRIAPGVRRAPGGSGRAVDGPPGAGMPPRHQGTTYRTRPGGMQRHQSLPLGTIVRIAKQATDVVQHPVLSRSR